jgi:hypothetical protein
MERKSSIRRRLTGFFLSLVMIISLFGQFASTAYAGVTVGSSGSISATGAKTGLNGGVSHIDKPVFRIGIMRDPGLWNNTSAQASKDIITSWAHRFPDNNESLFFTPNGYGNLYTNYEVGRYVASSRKMEKYSDSVSKARVQNLATSGGTKPYAKGRAVLAGYSFTGGGGTKLFSSLARGKWKTQANQITKADANALWSYVLADTSGGYDINNRLNGMISTEAGRNLTFSTIPDSEREDVAKGYLGVLMSTWVLTPTSLRGPWEQAIEDYLVNKDQGKGEKPSSIVIDTAMTMSFASTGKRLVMPSVDYFQYYTAVGAKWNITKTTDAKIGSARGDTYNMLSQIVKGDINESGNINRTSDRFDASNVMSFGASAIIYPTKWYNTSGGNGRWSGGASAVATMDTLTLGTHPNGGKIRGFLASGIHLEMAPEPPSPDPAVTKTNIKFTATPDNFPVPASSDVLTKPVTLTFKHPADKAILGAWQKVFKADTTKNKTLNIKIIPTRTASPTAKVAPAYTSSTGNLVTGVNMTQANFLAFLQGKMPLTIIDNTVNEPIAQGTTMTYTYKPKFEITYVLNGATTKAIIDLADTASFKRATLPPDPIVFTSEPSAYAELKEGTPDNESFEAMAGVPSNKRLYLGVGGSEYVVDIELEYKQNVDSVWRKYRSFYSGVDSEYKAGDTAPSKTVGGNSVNPHTGGSTTKSWSGSVPWTGSVTYSDHTTNVKNTWDMSAAIAAKAQADAWAATVNGTVISHTSVSEPKTRSFSAWGASTQGSASNGPAGWASPGQRYIAPTYDTKGVMTSPGQPYVAASGANGSAGSYSYTVTGTVPAHEICGPECTYVLPAVQDTWKQKVNFDYMKISRVEVYKIEEGRITSVDNLLGEGNSTLQATIKSTDPSTFVNIAQKNASGNDVEAQSSKFGRLRYTLDPTKHDFVEYNEGVRTNKSAGDGWNGNSVSAKLGQTHPKAGGILYTNAAYTDVKDFHKANSSAADKIRPEFVKFNERRTALNKATVISDMLILQTSSGDQSVMYFDKDTTTVQAQEQFPNVDATKIQMWDANVNSAAKWQPKQVNIGSYNGNYTESGGSNKKYYGYNQVAKNFTGSKPSVATAFDGNGVGINAGTPRPSKPNKLYMYGESAIEPTTPNSSYETGDAELFYERVLSWATPNPYPTYGAPLQDNMYDAQVQANFSSKLGFVLLAPYSDEHEKVNDVVIHTPVSVQDATIISLPSDRDQRTATPAGGADALIDEQNSLKVCPLDPALCEFRVLNCTHRMDTVLAEVDFENYTAGTILNKTTGVQIPYTSSTGITMANKTGFGSGKSLNAFGNRWSLNFADIGLTNDKLTTVLVEMDFWMPSPATGNTMVVSFDQYDFFIPTGGKGTWNTGNGVEKQLEGVNFKDNKMRLGLQVSLGSIEDSKVFINGVEQTTYTRVNDSKDVTGLIGTQLNIGSWGKDNNYAAQFYVDNLKVTKKGGTLSHTESCYITTVTHETKWTHVHDSSCYDTASPVNTSFSYTGAVQTFVAPHTGEYTLTALGAGGGAADPGVGGKGGYAKSTFTLTKGDTVSIYVGEGGVYNVGTGTNTTAYNGGGAGYQFGGTGGGATDFRLNDTTLTSRILVAGGGGGASDNVMGGNHGGGLIGGDVGHGKGGTQSAGGAGYNGGSAGTLGLGGKAGTGNNSGGGGGGGYYGGGAGSADNGSGGGGSSFVATDGKNTTNTLGGGASAGDRGTSNGKGGNGSASIVSSGGTGTILVCDNLPLNTLTQNNVHVHDATCVTEVAEEAQIIADTTPFAVSNMQLGAYSNPSNNFVIPSSVKVGDLAVIYTSNGNSENNSTSVPIVPSDFTPYGTPANGRQAYAKTLSSSDLGRTITFTGSVSSWGWAFFTVPSRFDLNVVTTSSLSTPNMGTGKDTGVVAIVPNIANVNGYTAGTSATAMLTYTRNLPAHTAVDTPLVQSSSWHSTTSVPHMIFVGGTGKGAIQGEYTNFNYTGAAQTFTAPAKGTYMLETWGAQGGTSSVSYPGGLGGYAKGSIALEQGETVTVSVGQQGFSTGADASTTFGGGGGGLSAHAKGGGATDIRKGGTSLSNRVIVAGGGGGTYYWTTNSKGGAGGGTVGEAAIPGNGGYLNNGGKGGTQTSGGAKGGAEGSSNNGTDGSLGIGGTAGSWSNSGGGGGGYYGGGGGNHPQSGGGGSSYIGGVTDSATDPGVRNGNGSARITTLLIADTSTGAGFGDYTWEEIFGPNWASYVTETTSDTTVGGGTPTTFAYSTTNGTFTVPSTGDYTLETWGAGGGASRNAAGGLGGYAKGTISLTQGDILSIATGGVGAGNTTTNFWTSRASGGFNGGGASGNDTDGNDNGANETGGGGGGFTIIKRGATTLLAGGGGGGGNYSSNGGAGSAGGGGGGSYGNTGLSGTGMDQTGNVKIGGNGGSLAGTGYVNALTDSVITAGVNNTNGYAKITSLPKVVTTTKTAVNWTKVKADVEIANFPQKMPDGVINPIFAKDALAYNKHVHTTACVVTKTLSCSEPHHSGGHYDGSSDICWDACGLDHNHQQLKAEVTKPNGSTVKSGTFVNMDYGFQIYFPNIGDFAQQVDLQGIGSITTSRGLGYVNGMDTTQYTSGKRVKFDFNVTYAGKIYPSGSWIDLPLSGDTFDFYAPLANSESMGSSVQFDVVPINGTPIGEPVNDNFYNVTNRERNYDFTSYHGAFKEAYVDLVGRIGNFVVSDTEDFRFSNTFKQDSTSGKWLVEGLVKEVDSDRQKKYYGDMVDIRGFDINSTGTRLDTYGSQPWMRQAPLAFPVNPKDNDNPALKEEFLKVGYDILGDIQTTGSYQDGVIRVLPYYFKLDVASGIITPLDVYTKTSDVYKPVNIYKGADGGSLPANLNPYDLILDWAKEAPRRNFTMDESIITDRVAAVHGEYILGPVTDPSGATAEGVTGIKRLTTPLGNFVNVGNAQRLIVDKKARTFIGSTQTNGVEMNLGSALPLDDWEYAAQRWHMKLGLPSSSVFVTAGQPVNKANIDTVKSGNAVILMSADIISIGELYSLRWKQPGITSFTVTKGGKTTPFNIANSGLPPVIALYDLTNTAVIDVTVKGSH